MDRLIKYFVPEKYILDIEIDKNAKTIGGTVVVEGRASGEYQIPCGWLIY